MMDVGPRFVKASYFPQFRPRTELYFPMQTPARKYVAYYRVSTKKQGDSGLGIEAQHVYIEHFYQGKNVIAAFTDIQSGKDLANRPELQKAIALCAHRATP